MTPSSTVPGYIQTKSYRFGDLSANTPQVCILVESCLLTYLTTLGYGLHIWDVPTQNLQAIMLRTSVAGTFPVTSAVWSKTSFGITLLLITDGWIRKTILFCIISMNVSSHVPVRSPSVAQLHPHPEDTGPKR
jgi:hypothetical protein